MSEKFNPSSKRSWTNHCPIKETSFAEFDVNQISKVYRLAISYKIQKTEDHLKF